MRESNGGSPEKRTPRWLALSAGAVAGTLYGGAAGLVGFWLVGGLVLGCCLPLAWLVPVPAAFWFSPGGPLTGVVMGDVLLSLFAVIGFFAGIREGARSGLDRWEVGYPLLAALVAGPLGWLAGFLVLASLFAPGKGMLAPLAQPHSVAWTSASVIITSLGVLFGVLKGSPLFR